MKTIDISEYGLEFKNIVSGPAQPGRVLNYIYKAGTSNFYHVNGYRYTDLKDNVGCAWTTEFMIGLDLIYLGGEVENSFLVKLTEKGDRIFSLINSKEMDFNEGANSSDINILKKQIKECHSELFETLKLTFMNSIPFYLLKDFLLKNGFEVMNTRKFKDDYFESLKRKYDSHSGTYNRESRTSTAQNRIPSLLQFCELFDLLKKNGNKKIMFEEIRFREIDPEIIGREFLIAELMPESEKREEILLSFKELSDKYGIDGNVYTSSVVRNSTLQAKFKHNLIIEQEGECMICKMKTKELLIASHIKPAADSNVFEKIDKYNGLLLCCNHDRLFDKHLISFDSSSGKILISKYLSKEEQAKLDLDYDYRLPNKILTPERSKYLKLHNQSFIELNNN